MAIAHLTLWGAKKYMHLMILWNSALTSKEMRKYLTIHVVNIFVKMQNKESGQNPVHL